MSGGYDDGYRRSPCFWGKEPGSLVRALLSECPNLSNTKVLDLGCGEGKNAFALANAGAEVVAVECSEAALRNGMAQLSHPNIQWVHSDANSYLSSAKDFDIVVMYGLLHCLSDAANIESCIRLAKQRTRAGGQHIVVAFNDGPHDLSAHPELSPTLVSHEHYLRQYADCEIVRSEDAIIRETHPHNGIEHFHSISRIWARRF